MKTLFPSVSALLTLTALGLACTDSNSAAPTESAATPSLSASHNAVNGAEFGFTAGWLDGRTVQFFYHKLFFCRTPL